MHTIKVLKYNSIENRKRKSLLRILSDSLKKSLRVIKVCFTLMLFADHFLTINCQWKVCWQCEDLEIVEHLSSCINCCLLMLSYIQYTVGFVYLFGWLLLVLVSVLILVFVWVTGKFQYGIKNWLVLLFIFFIKTASSLLLCLQRCTERIASSTIRVFMNYLG